MRSLAVYLNETRIGTLHETDDLWNFEYEVSWQESTNGFDLSPALPRSTRLYQDGASVRPVQWYFDNLLPEEKLREAVSREAGIRGDDAFALLEYLGRESAGSLILVPPDTPATKEGGGLQPLTDEVLSQRIQNIPRVPLSSTAPKRMSAAGTQNKLLVVYRDGALYEPTGSEPSTHILKPDNTSADYPATVINEYMIMKLAAALHLPVPQVYRRYVPEPVYIVERFDRYQDEGSTQRTHIIDACQLLNKSRLFKYTAATLDAMGETIERCTNKARTRIVLFQWLTYNILIGNNDNHLKNLSFRVDHEGIALCPLYDLLSTVVYHTRLFAQERADWPEVPLTISLPGCSAYNELNRPALLAAGEKLGLPARICERELTRISRALLAAMDELVRDIQTDNAALPEGSNRFLAGETRLLDAIRHIVTSEMLRKIPSPSA
jgi:serine/threonine-protein kinase HipA